MTAGSMTDLIQQPTTAASRPAEEGPVDHVLEVTGLAVHYGKFTAVRDITLDLPRNRITALIGPSGCGKSTVLRAMNRMNDLVPNARVEGQILFNGEDIYAPDVDAGEVRRRVGMVFQKPNPFPKSIYDNVAYGPRLNDYKGDMDELVERSLREAFLWDEVKSKLDQSGLALSGGQQQRLCIARAIAVDPEVVLMDEPCSALDPIATARIEDLMIEMADRFTIVIVTHNMQQAARVSHRTAFFSIDMDDETKDRTGGLVEYDTSDVIFSRPNDPRTEAYVSGRFG